MELSYNIPTKREKYALISLILCIFIPSYNYYINDIIQLNLGMGSVSALFYLFLAAVGLYSYTFLSRINKKLLVIMFLVMLALFTSYLVYPEIKDAFISKDYNPLTSILLFIPLMGFPMMVYTNYLNRNIYYIVDYIRYPSLLLIILSIIDYYWTVFVNDHFFEINYMSFSYFMLPGVCCSFYYGVTKGKILDIILSIIGLIVILVTGSRWCFLCGVVFLALTSFQRYTISAGKVLLYFLSIVAIFLILSHFFASFSDSVMSYMDEHGASSRTLLKISDGSFEESSSREAIYSLMLEAIDIQPFGYGLMGDRFILHQHGNQGYAHSIIYEFLIDYGIILGSVFLVILVVSLFLKFKQFFKSDILYIYAAFFVLGFVKLFVSGSYLGETYFWGLIGMLFIKKR